MSAKYINPKLPSMIRNLHKGDPSMNSVKTMLGLAADLVQELIDLRAEQGETGKLRAVEKFVADAEEAGVILDLAERFATSADRAAGVVDRAWRDGLRRILGPVPDTTNSESEDE